MKDKEMKFEDVKDPHRGTQGGSSYILFLYINSDKEVVNNWEVELYKPRSISLTVNSVRDWRAKENTTTSGSPILCERIGGHWCVFIFSRIKKDEGQGKESVKLEL